MNLDIEQQNPLAMYKLLTNLVVPRPIAWVTSKDAKGRLNLAPFSFFNMVGWEPPVVVIGVGNEADGRPKHTGRNIAATKEFVVNLVTEELVQAMNLTAADFPEGHSELEAAGLHEAKSLMVSVAAGGGGAGGVGVRAVQAGARGGEQPGDWTGGGAVRGRRDCGSAAAREWVSSDRADGKSVGVCADGGPV